MKKFTKAILLTGAAARISQEVAIIDKLCARKENPLKIKEEDSLIAGFSSGSLNLTALNACFRNKNPMDWKTYYQEQILFPLKNEDVFTKNKRLSIPLFNTSPLRNTLYFFLADTNLHLMKDLPFHSSILTMLKRKGKDKRHHKNRETLWACSEKTSQEYLSLSDVLMASTAIPVAFPAQEIHVQKGHTTDFPLRKYRDGGTQGTFVDFDTHIGDIVRNQGAFEEMYIISPMREASDETVIEMDNSILDDIEDLDKIKLTNFLSNISMKTFMKFLVKLEQWKMNNEAMAKNIFVCIPEMESNFPILDFSQEKAQYKATRSWFDGNKSKLAVPLADFIKSHQEFV